MDLFAFAAVVESQTKGYEVNLSPLNKAGELWGIGGVDGGGERDRNAVGIELAIPATENLRSVFLQDMMNMMMPLLM